MEVYWSRVLQDSHPVALSCLMSVFMYMVKKKTGHFDRMKTCQPSLSHYSHSCITTLYENDMFSKMSVKGFIPLTESNPILALTWIYNMGVCINPNLEWFVFLWLFILALETTLGASVADSVKNATTQQHVALFIPVKFWKPNRPHYGPLSAIGVRHVTDPALLLF